MVTHLEKEINEQSAAVTRLLAAQRENVTIVATAIRDFNPAFVMLVARGTSDNAARYAQYLFGIQAQLPVALATPSVHTLYGSQPNLSRALVIGISQSGQSDDVRQVITDAKQQGALTISITNDASSPLANATSYHIALHAGVERSVAATKTYTTELAALALLVQALRKDEAALAQLDSLSGWMNETLQLNESIANWVERYRYAQRLAVIGRGYNYATAFEISLKIKELCYISSEEYSEADFRHGPIAIVNTGFPVIVVAPRGKTLALMRDLLKNLADLDAEALVISNDSATFTSAHRVMPVPAAVPEWLSPICAVIPGQLFAWHLAEAKGHDVDTPRGLKKVTKTR